MSVIEQVVPTGTWAIDPVHSTIEFRVKHLGVSTFRGRFDAVEGSLSDADGEPRLYGKVPVESVSVKPDLKGHLLTPDFFDAERHPEITFESTSLRREGDEVVVEGNLTIKSHTHAVSGRGTIGEPGPNLAGGESVGIELETTIDRNQYGVDWQAELPGGKLVLGTDVRVVIELELAKAA